MLVILWPLVQEEVYLAPVLKRSRGAGQRAGLAPAEAAGGMGGERGCALSRLVCIENLSQELHCLWQNSWRRPHSLCHHLCRCRQCHLFSGCLFTAESKAYATHGPSLTLGRQWLVPASELPVREGKSLPFSVLLLPSSLQANHLGACLQGTPPMRGALNVCLWVGNAQGQAAMTGACITAAFRVSGSSWIFKAQHCSKSDSSGLLAAWATTSEIPGGICELLCQLT